MYALPSTADIPLGPAPERSLFSTFARRRRLFAIVVLAIVSLALVATILSPRTYTTHVTFIAGGSAGPVAPAGQTDFPVLNAILDISNSQSSETYAEIMRQPQAAQVVIDKLGLHATPGQVLGAVAVNPIPNTSILDARVTWSSPDLSARIANTLAQAYVDLRRDLISHQADASAATIAGELHSAQTRMQHSADALARYQASNGIADLQQQTNGTIAALAATDVKISTVRLDQRQASAQRAVVQSEMAKVPALMSGGTQLQANPVLTQLRTQLATIDVQLQSARRQYTDDHPTVKALVAQRQELARMIDATPATTTAAVNTVGNPLHTALQQQDASLAAEIAADNAQLSELSSQRAHLEPLLRALPRQAEIFATLQRTAKVDRDVFDALEQKYAQAEIARSTTLSDVAVLSPADPKTFQKKPNVLVNLAAGLALAVLFGIGAIAVAERFDRRIKAEDEVTERLRLPLLTSVPALPPSGRPFRDWMHAARIDSILQLVTSLRYASTERLRSVAFTSASAQDGKSTIALETAIAMAELEPRVLLIDADLRRPSLHTSLNVERSPGLSDVLVGKATLADVTRPTRHPGLDVITAGTSVPNPFVLLQSAAFDELLKSVKSSYGTVLVDTPACGAVVDAAAVCARVDGTVYVVSANATDLVEAARGIARLSAGGVRRIVGAVLNRTTPQRSAIGPYGQALNGHHQPALPPHPAPQSP